MQKPRKCTNKHCKAETERKDLCETCDRIWKRTVKIANEAYERDKTRLKLGI